MRRLKGWTRRKCSPDRLGVVVGYRWLRFLKVTTQQLGMVVIPGKREIQLEHSLDLQAVLDPRFREDDAGFFSMIACQTENA